jgi:hypothetical protein
MGTMAAAAFAMSATAAAILSPGIRQTFRADTGTGAAMRSAGARSAAVIGGKT